MEWKELILDGYGRIEQKLEPILKGLTKKELDWQPCAACNTIGWTVWHLARVQDVQIAELMGEDQVYLKDKWYERFKREADPEDTGFGDSAEDVAAFRSPDVKTQMGYLRATLEQSRNYLNSISPEDLDRVLNEPWFKPLPTVAVRLVSILADGHQHAGEVSYIHGLMKEQRKALKASLKSGVGVAEALAK
jgi:hypothetical protein